MADSNVRRPTLESHERSDSNQRQWCDSLSSPPPRLTLIELGTISAAFRTICLQTHTHGTVNATLLNPLRDALIMFLGEARFELWPRFVWVEIHSLFVLCVCVRKINEKCIFMCLKLEIQTFLSSGFCAVCFMWDKHYFQSVVVDKKVLIGLSMLQTCKSCNLDWTAKHIVSFLKTKNGIHLIRPQHLNPCCISAR